MLGKITIRNIPVVILNALEELSMKHDRSIEGEARHALKQWVTPVIEAEEKSARRFEVSNRLNALLNKSNEVLSESFPVHLSVLAEAIGHSRAESVEDWFTGKLEPTFAELEQVAAYLGGNPHWLKHGKGGMYEIIRGRIPEDPREAVRSLLNIGSGKPVESLYILRSASDAGELMFVKQLNASGLEFEAILTPYHVSEVIGAGGEAALKHLSIIFELLFKTYTKSIFPVSIIKSYLVDEAAFKSIANGKVHPIAVVRDQFGERHCEAYPWWEDFWDQGMFARNNYWNGWNSVTARVLRIVESQGSHTASLEKIRSTDMHEYWADKNEPQ